jgi:hypothetical protein
MGDHLMSAFSATVRYADLTAEIRLDCRFDGVKVRLDAAKIRSTDGSSLAPRDLTQLELRAVVHEAASAAVHPGHGTHLDRRPGKRPTPEELRLVAAVYWAQFVTWGNPRKAIMEYWDLPSHTAVRWIRKARECYGLPDNG